jgi:hypothetical protein
MNASPDLCQNGKHDSSFHQLKAFLIRFRMMRLMRILVKLKTGIRIHQKYRSLPSVVDPDLLNPDTDPGPGF